MLFTSFQEQQRYVEIADDEGQIKRIVRETGLALGFKPTGLLRLS